MTRIWHWQSFKSKASRLGRRKNQSAFREPGHGGRSDADLSTLLGSTRIMVNIESDERLQLVKVEEADETRRPQRLWQRISLRLFLVNDGKYIIYTIGV